VYGVQRKPEAAMVGKSTDIDDRTSAVDKADTENRYSMT